MAPVTLGSLVLCAITFFLPLYPFSSPGALETGGRAASASGTAEASGAPDAQRSDEELIKVTLHDLDLVDQDGNAVKFKSDIIGDRVAVIIPFYTTCTTSYPILIFMFTRLQEMLGDRLGREVVLVSVSVDPKTDIPVRLKAFSRKQKARSGWVFLSGDRYNLGEVLLGVGVLFSSNVDDHNHIPITLVGNARDEWRRFHGFPSPEQVLEEIDRLLKGRQET
ncbi:MAG: SCO family protein [Deltaproteobacteria bacterium]|nr:SCO family protein [Deltaproteobacteria bacterium]